MPHEPLSYAECIHITHGLLLVAATERMAEGKSLSRKLYSAISGICMIGKVNMMFA